MNPNLSDSQWIILESFCGDSTLRFSVLQKRFLANFLGEKSTEIHPLKKGSLKQEFIRVLKGLVYEKYLLQQTKEKHVYYSLTKKAYKALALRRRVQGGPHVQILNALLLAQDLARDCKDCLTLIPDSQKEIDDKVRERIKGALFNALAIMIMDKLNPQKFIDKPFSITFQFNGKNIRKFKKSRAFMRPSPSRPRYKMPPRPHSQDRSS